MPRSDSNLDSYEHTLNTLWATVHPDSQRQEGRIYFINARQNVNKDRRFILLKWQQTGNKGEKKLELRVYKWLFGFRQGKRFLSEEIVHKFKPSKIIRWVLSYFMDLRFSPNKNRLGHFLIEQNKKIIDHLLDIFC